MRDKATWAKITDPERQAEPARDVARAAGGRRIPEAGGRQTLSRGDTDADDASDAGVASLAEGAGAAPLLEKGEKLFREGDVAGALAAFDEAAKVDPKDARPHYLKGVALEKKGDNPAPPPPSKAMKLKADFAEAHNNLGVLLLARNDLPGPAGEFEAAVKAKPAYAEAQYNLGVARDGLGQKEEAVVAYKEAVRLKAGDAATG